MAAEEGKTVALNELGIEQLNQLQKQVEQEVQFFDQSGKQLKVLLARNDATIQALADVSETKPNHSALIPLSESLYIRAELSDPNKFLVEVGTGYFAELDREKAKAIFERKRDHITKQIQTIEGISRDKRRTRGIISDTFQAKVQAQLAQMAVQQK